MPQQDQQDKVIFTLHNTLFTLSAIGFLLPKAILAYRNNAGVVNSLDLVYGLFWDSG